MSPLTFSFFCWVSIYCRCILFTSFIYKWLCYIFLQSCNTFQFLPSSEGKIYIINLIVKHIDLSYVLKQNCVRMGWIKHKKINKSGLLLTIVFVTSTGIMPAMLDCPLLVGGWGHISPFRHNFLHYHL